MIAPKQQDGVNSVTSLLKSFSFALLLSLGLFIKIASAKDPAILRIAVAANFTPVLTKILPEFHQRTGIKTQIISGASGALFLQIKHGAPFDIFLSADQRRPQQLEQDGLILAGSRATYAIGQLALFSHGKITQLTKLIPKRSLENNVSRFAIANPLIAPYGKAAKETLEHLGLWQAYQPRLITGMNINQTFNQIRSKSVELGLVAYSQLVLNNLTGLLIPNHYHQAIKQQLVVLKRSPNQVKARQLADFLRLTSTQKIIARYGYLDTAQRGH